MAKHAESGFQILVGATLIWGSVLLVTASDGGISVPEYIAYFFGGLLFAGVTALVCVVLVVVAIRRRQSLKSALPVALRIQGAFLAFVYVGVSYDLAFATRFQLSRGALTRAAQEMRSRNDKTAESRWIGLFRVEEADIAGQSVRFITSACGFDDCGVAYSEDGEPPQKGEDSYLHMKGPWWRWHRSW